MLSKRKVNFEPLRTISAQFTGDGFRETVANLSKYNSSAWPSPPYETDKNTSTHNELIH